MLLKQKVRDRMIPIGNYPTVLPDVTLKEATLSLRTSFCELETGMCTEAGPRTVLIVDNAGKVIGILDFKSFLETMIPEIAGGLSAKLSALGVSIAFAQADAEALDESRLGFRARVIKNAEAKVRDIMLKVRGTIDADARLIDGMKQMFRNKIIVLPVYEGDKLVGVLRDTDLFLAVADVLEE
jgi:CBS domain-containing protein